MDLQLIANALERGGTIAKKQNKKNKIMSVTKDNETFMKRWWKI